MRSYNQTLNHTVMKRKEAIFWVVVLIIGIWYLGYVIGYNSKEKKEAEQAEAIKTYKNEHGKRLIVFE